MHTLEYNTMANVGAALAQDSMLTLEKAVHAFRSTTHRAMSTMKNIHALAQHGPTMSTASIVHTNKVNMQLAIYRSNKTAVSDGMMQKLT